MKTSLILIAVSGLAVTACATTATNGPKTMDLSAKVTDADMSCSDLQIELAKLDGVIGENKALTNNAGAEVAASATSTAVRYGAVKSGAAGVPGLGAAINIFDNANRQRVKADKERAATTAQDAEMRHSRLNGLYEGKNCAAQTKTEAVASE